jgi:hypothetical protein
MHTPCEQRSTPKPTDQNLLHARVCVALPYFYLPLSIPIRESAPIERHAATAILTHHHGPRHGVRFPRQAAVRGERRREIRSVYSPGEQRH